jgi:hypothetical protein
VTSGAARRPGSRAACRADLPVVPRRQDQRPYLLFGAAGNAAGMTQAGARGGGRSAEPAAPPRQLIDQLLRAAAASMHNTQPWRFQVRDAGRTIELRADPARQLPYSDPSGRAAHIACGAALFNLRLAAAVAGQGTDVRLLPDPREPLHAAIDRRHTNRQPFSSRPVPPGLLAGLAQAASLEHAILHILDHDEAVRVLNLAADAERAQLADPGYRAELARWVGGQRDRDGIPDSALGPRSPDSPTPVRDLTPGPQSLLVRYAWFEGTPQLAVLSTRSGSRADWLRASACCFL